MSSVTSLINDLKAEEIPWSRLLSAYGTAEDFPKYIKYLENAETALEAVHSLGSDIEHQSTMFPCTPFALIFLVRARKKYSHEDTDTAKAICDELDEMFGFFGKVIEEYGSISYDEAHEDIMDMLKEEYLIPEDMSDDVFDDDEMLEQLMSDRQFYSCYYYSGLVLKEII